MQNLDCNSNTVPVQTWTVLKQLEQRAPGRFYTIRELAVRTGVNEKYLRAILQRFYLDRLVMRRYTGSGIANYRANI
jgi:hypothetical protein